MRDATFSILAMTVAQRRWILLIGALAGYLLLMLTNPIRGSLRDGLRALVRYRRLWSIPALFGFCYALFQAALRVFYFFILPESSRPGFAWNWSWALPAASLHLSETHNFRDWLLALFADPRWLLVKESAIESAENLAGVFNNVITTFPFSALAAILLLANWDDHHTALRRALQKRFGRAGRFIHAGILLCAIAAILKPLLFGPTLFILNRHAPGLLILRWSAIIDWLSFLFECLFGVCIQIYLILIVFAWVRGMHWTRAHLLDVAIRRFSFVMKWAALVMLASSLLIDLPRIVALLAFFQSGRVVESTLRYIDNVARPLLSLFLIVFASVQITLTFHSESLRKAVRDHFQFLRKHRGQFLWFLLIATLHFFFVGFANRAVVRGFGEETANVFLWRLIYPLLAASVAAWMLAAWVCLFKRCETGRLHSENILPR